MIKDKNFILVQAGKGSYAKDILDLEFNVNEEILKFSDILDKIFQLEEENKNLKIALLKMSENQNKIDSLFTTSLDLAQKKICRIEKQLEEL